MAGEFAFLETVSVNDHGAFLDWGLPKDLFVPLKEQKSPLRKGDQALVFVYTDARDGRIVGTTRIERHLGLTSPDYAPGTPVTLLITAGPDLGYKAIVDNAHWGCALPGRSLRKTLPRTNTAGLYQEGPRGRKDRPLPARPGYKKIGDIQGRILTALEKAAASCPTRTRQTRS
jgi:hypothetical protein